MPLGLRPHLVGLVPWWKKPTWKVRVGVGSDRRMAQGPTRRETQEGFGWIDASSLCKTAGYERSYS